MKAKKFEVYTRDGEVVATGDSNDCSYYMGLSYRAFIVAVYETKVGKRTGKRSGLLVREVKE